MSDELDPFDSVELSPALAAELIAANAKRDSGRVPAKKAGGQLRFVKFPRMWWECLAKARASGSVYRVAIYLLYEAIRSKTFRSEPPVVKLSNAVMKRWGVGREGKVAALQALRTAGLVRVEERPKKSPLVTVLFVD